MNNGEKDFVGTACWVWPVMGADRIMGEDLPVPGDEELLALPLVEKPWELEMRPVGWVQGLGGLPSVRYLTAVVDEDGSDRAVLECVGHRPRPKEIADIIRIACLHPEHDCAPARPRIIEIGLRLKGKGWAIRHHLGPLDVLFQKGSAEMALATLRAFEYEDPPDTVPAWLTWQHETALGKFLEASQSFVDARSEWGLDRDVLVGLTLGQGEELLVFVVGHMDSEIGYLMFEHSKDALRFMKSLRSQSAKPSGSGRSVLGRLDMAIESVCLLPVHRLHPADADWLLLLDWGLRPMDLLLVPIQITEDGPMPPRMSLADHSHILSALTLFLSELLESDEESREGIVDGVAVKIRKVPNALMGV